MDSRALRDSMARADLEDKLSKAQEEPTFVHVQRADYGHLLNCSKKQLAKEVHRLQGVVEKVKGAALNLDAELKRGQFNHVEAFRLMRYVLRPEREGVKPIDLDTGEAVKPAEGLPAEIFIWNSRDGVTPFVVHLKGGEYQHDLGWAGYQSGARHYDAPAEATHRWETRSDAQVLAAWRRTLSKAVNLGRIDPSKAESLQDSLETAKSWNYNIGLRDLTTGLLTDEDTADAAN